MALETETKTEEQFVTITPTALSQIKNVIAAQNKEDLFLRIFVQGGCGGTSYGMAIDMRKQPDDHEYMVEGLLVVVDRISHQYVGGANVDYDDSAEKAGFRIVNEKSEELFSQMGGGSCCGGTDDATAGCGGGSCGTSSGDSGGGCC